MSKNRLISQIGGIIELKTRETEQRFTILILKGACVTLLAITHPTVAYFPDRSNNLLFLDP